MGMNRGLAATRLRSAAAKTSTAVLSALLVAGLTVAGFVGFVGLAPLPSAAAETAKWDPRIAPIAKEVEKLRGLTFKHAVPVEFLGEKAFNKRVAVDDGKLSKSERAQYAQSASQLSAIGLMNHGVDLAKSLNSLQTSGVLAYYSPDTKRVTVRGTTLDVAKRVTLAHELTHALQDQYFDLNKLQAAADKDHSSSALKALVEGDAVRVQNDYVKQLSAADQKAYTTTNDAATDKAKSGVDAQGVPGAVEALFESPYDFGPLMLDVVISQQKKAGVNALFRKPPTADSSFLTPSTLFDGSKVTKVAAPKLATGEKRIGTPDSFGPFSLYLMLATRQDPGAALTIADGWGGDSMVTYKSAPKAGGNTCVRVAMMGRTPAATQAIAGALGQWAAAMPAGSADVATKAGIVTLSTCDVAAARPAATHDASEVLTVAASRDALLGEIANEGVPIVAAECTATGVVRDPAFAPVLAASSDDQLDASVLAALRARVSTIALGCARGTGSGQLGAGQPGSGSHA
jgi:hypothetical protein